MNRKPQTTIYRIQDNEGRGPWKPGFSHRWVRPDPDHELIPWFSEWPKYNPAIYMRAGEVAATGCRSLEQLRRWFNEDEYASLVLLGYEAVKIKGVRILRSNNKQTLFASNRPLIEISEPFDLYD